MNNYLITLTPVGRFFFGGDMTFSVKDNKEHNEKYSSYIIESNPFPQQTSLLGMLRFLILSNDSEAFDMDKQEIKAVAKERENQELSYVEKLIGATSFVLTENNAEQNFGKIRNLSSCILQMSQDGSNWENLLPTPPVFEKSVNFATATEASLNGKTILLPTINNYDAKEWYEALFSSSDNSIQLKSSDIFCKDQRIGIEKDYSGKTQDGALFKQISYRFGKKDDPKQYRFAFNADIDTDITPYNGQLVSIGGDNSKFIIHFHKELIDYTILSENRTGKEKLVLLSHAYLTAEDIKHVCFAITETQPFRFLKTTVDTQNYTILSQKVTRSEKYNLYKAGSVFYFNDKDALETLKTALENKKNFRQIGYNQYQIIRTK